MGRRHPRNMDSGGSYPLEDSIGVFVGRSDLRSVSLRALYLFWAMPCPKSWRAILHVIVSTPPHRRTKTRRRDVEGSVAHHSGGRAPPRGIHLSSPESGATTASVPAGRSARDAVLVLKGMLRASAQAQGGAQPQRHPAG